MNFLRPSSEPTTGKMKLRRRSSEEVNVNDDEEGLTEIEKQAKEERLSLLGLNCAEQEQKEEELLIKVKTEEDERNKEAQLITFDASADPINSFDVTSTITPLSQQQQQLRRLPSVQSSRLPLPSSKIIDEENMDEQKEDITKPRQFVMPSTKLAYILMAVMLLVLVSMLGGSITISRIISDIETKIVDFDVAQHSKRSGSIVQIPSNIETQIFDMTNQELLAMKELILMDGAIQFNVKGYSKSHSGDKVIMIVEGGTITFDEEGILDATDTAKMLLDNALPKPIDWYWGEMANK